MKLNLHMLDINQLKSIEANHMINSYHQAEDYFFRALSTQCLDTTQIATAYMTGVPTRDHNFVYVRKPIDLIDALLTRCKEFYDQENLLFTVLIPKEFCTPEIKQATWNAGYYQAGNSIAMVAELKSAAENQLDQGLTICQHGADLTNWMIPLVEAFVSTLNITSRYVKAHNNATEIGADLRHFSLYENGEIVSSMTLSLHNTFARIDDVATLPSFQRKGYASKLVKYALSEAYKLGATHCFLEASDYGLPLYHRLGFSPLFENNIYSYADTEPF